MSFDGKVVLITGAASGIGANTAIHLAKLGAKVSMVDIDEKSLTEVAEKILTSGSPAPLPILADVTKETDRIVDETIKTFGRIDILVNNAGVAVYDSIVDVNLSNFDRIFDVNVRSIIKLTNACVPHLEKTSGNIVNISSAVSFQALKKMMSYSMSKSAIEMFTKCSALDLAAKKIRVNSVHPALIRTPILRNAGIGDKDITAMLERIASKYPVGRVGEASDVSEAIAYLANEKSASFLTGVALPIDGGSLTSGTIA